MRAHGSAIPAALGRLGFTFQERWAGPVSPVGRGSRPTRPPEEPPETPGAAAGGGRECAARRSGTWSRSRSGGRRECGVGVPGAKRMEAGAGGVSWAWHTPGTSGLETGTGLGVPGPPLSRPRALPGLEAPLGPRPLSRGAGKQARGRGGAWEREGALVTARPAGKLAGCETGVRGAQPAGQG